MNVVKRGLFSQQPGGRDRALLQAPGLLAAEIGHGQGAIDDGTTYGETNVLGKQKTC